MVLGVAIILVLIWFYTAGSKYGNISVNTPDSGITISTASSTPVAISSSTDSLPSVITKPATQHPLIKRPLKFSSTLSSTERASIQDKVNAQQVFLEKNPRDPFLWINMGSLRLIAGDTTGAKEAWEYVKVLAPKDGVPYFNLAAMYADNLKEYGAATVEYTKALELSPQNSSGYIALAQIYTDAYKTDTDLAEKTLVKGIAIIPNAYEIQVSLARFYSARQRNAEAKAMYAKAEASAIAAGRKDVAASIKAEAGE